MVEKTSATYQDNLLDVFGLAPVEHPGGVVFLDVLVHTLNLLVPRDEEGVVSNQGKPGRGRNVKKKKNEGVYMSKVTCKYVEDNRVDPKVLISRLTALTTVVKVAFSLSPLPIFCSFLSQPIHRNANKTAMSSSRVTSAAAARRKAMAATYCTDWHEHRDAITPPYCIQLLTYLCCAVKALTDQTLNISVICPIIFAFQTEGY